MSKPMYVWNGSTWEEVGPVVPQTPIAYQASAPVSPSTGDIWVDSDGDVGTFDRQLVRYRFVASGGETSLSGVDANGFTLAYVPGAEQVYLNGVLLVRTSDYTATNGTSITALSPALAANDVVEVFAYNSFNLANTYTKAEVDGSLDLIAQNGLVHIETQSVSGVAAVSFNNVFSATYDNYKIVAQTTGTAGASLTIRLRASGTDLTSNVYELGQIYVGLGTAFALGSVNSSTSTSGQAFVISNGYRSGGSIDMMSPFLTEYTHWSGVSAGWLTVINGVQVPNTNSYDGFTALATSITGTISVYGYRKS